MKITTKQYAQTLFDLTDGKSKPEIEKSVADFARYIYKERKLALADKIIEQFGKIYNQRKGIVETEVTSRKKMDETTSKKIKHYVKEKYQAKEVIVKNIVDESAKGGVVIKVGDEIIDGSVRGKLGELRKVLT
ncbi:MAG: ATP synthase F1 subunit delta [Patescibacteria group bacterium]|nr:ATP synthase F1 subunit delta [Patescibacteria group bacterium]